MKTKEELIEYIDHTIASLFSDYTTIYDATKILYETMPKETRARLEWNLVHQHTQITVLINDLKRHQELLKKEMNAGQQV